MKLRLLVAVLLSIGVVGCSGGGGSGGGSSSTNPAASGVMALPTATCASGSVCLQSLGGFSSSSVSSGELVLTNAEFAYNYVRETYIPAVNQLMYQVEEAFKSKGYTACGGAVTDVNDGTPQIDGIPNGTYPLDDTYTAVVSNGTTGSMEKKFVLSRSGQNFLEVQVYCPNSSERTIYIRTVSGSTWYEAWGFQDSTTKKIYAATDVGSEKRTLYFSSTGSAFEISGIIKDAVMSSGGSAQSLVIGGGANLSSVSGKVDVQMSYGLSDTLDTGKAYDSNIASYSATHVRHCYTSMDASSVTTPGTPCSGLFNGPGTLTTFRGGPADMTSWNVNTLGSAAIPTTF